MNLSECNELVKGRIKDEAPTYCRNHETLLTRTQVCSLESVSWNKNYSRTSTDRYAIFREYLDSSLYISSVDVYKRQTYKKCALFQHPAVNTMWRHHHRSLHGHH